MHSSGGEPRVAQPASTRDTLPPHPAPRRANADPPSSPPFRAPSSASRVRHGGAMATDIRAALAPPPGAGTPDLVARFAERAGAVGVIVHQVSDLDELALLVAELSHDLAGGDAVVAPG